MFNYPCMPFYPSEFLMEVTFLSDEQLGRYIKLLCYNHVFGRLDEEKIRSICHEGDDKILALFKRDEDGLFYHQRLEYENEKREAYSTAKVGKKAHKEKKRAQSVDKGVGKQTNTVGMIANTPLESEEREGDNKASADKDRAVSDTENKYNTEKHASALSESVPEAYGQASDTKTEQGRAREPKKTYGRFANVMLTDSEYRRLKKEFPSNYERKIDDLSVYIEQSGVKYRSHYATILSWDNRSKAGSRGKMTSYDPDDFFSASLKNAMEQFRAELDLSAEST